MRHPGLMPFVRVKPDDMSQVTAVACIEEAARQVDDPDAFPPIAEMLAAEMRYGWDLDAQSTISTYLRTLPTPSGRLCWICRRGTTCIWCGSVSSYIPIIAATAMVQ